MDELRCELVARYLEEMTPQAMAERLVAAEAALAAEREKLAAALRCEVAAFERAKKAERELIDAHDALHDSCAPGFDFPGAVRALRLERDRLLAERRGLAARIRALRPEDFYGRYGYSAKAALEAAARIVEGGPEPPRTSGYRDNADPSTFHLPGEPAPPSEEPPPVAVGAKAATWCLEPALQGRGRGACGKAFPCPDHAPAEPVASTYREAESAVGGAAKCKHGVRTSAELCDDCANDIIDPPMIPSLSVPASPGAEPMPSGRARASYHGNPAGWTPGAGTVPYGSAEPALAARVVPVAFCHRCGLGLVCVRCHHPALPGSAPAAGVERRCSDAPDCACAYCAAVRAPLEAEVARLRAELVEAADALSDAGRPYDADRARKAAQAEE